MRLTAVFAVAAAALLPFAFVCAAGQWSAPGYYVIADTSVGVFILGGPYGDAAGCAARLPADDEDIDYVCGYLETRPAWDQ